MKLSDPCSEAEWITETIIDDFAVSLDLSDRARFYAHLMELLTERRNSAQRALDSTDSEPDSLKPVH